MTLGAMSGGTIDPENDTDLFSITLSETTHVIVWAAHKDVYLPYDYDKKYYERIDVDRTLLDSGGNPVAANLREKALALPLGFYLRDTLAAGTHYLKVVGNPRPNDVRIGPYVIWAEQDTEYGDFLDDCTAKPTSYSDPLFGCQWHPDNTGQGQGTSGEDINVTPVWADGNMGEGITVAVLDDGVDPDTRTLRTTWTRRRATTTRGSPNWSVPTKPMAPRCPASSQPGITAWGCGELLPGPPSIPTTSWPSSSRWKTRWTP